MARRRRKSTFKRTIRASPRRSAFKRTTRRKKSSSSGMGGDMALLLGSGIYGAGRARASEALAPLTAKIPAGDYADEIMMGTLGYLLYKKKIPFIKKLGISKDIGRAALIVEAARMGDGLSQGLMPSTQAKSPVTNKGFTGF